METKFTPGPWTIRSHEPAGHSVEAPGFTEGHQSRVAWCPMGIEAFSPANAHLIAAAPELYEALMGTLNWLHMHDAVGAHDAAGKALAALRKARGEQ